MYSAIGKTVLLIVWPTGKSTVLLAGAVLTMGITRGANQCTKIQQSQVEISWRVFRKQLGC